MTDKMDSDYSRLPIELKYTVERQVRRSLMQFASVIGIVNIVALVGIYFTVSSFVAERAAESAANTAKEFTQNQMAATTEQLNNLTKDSLEKAINASVASLNAEQQAMKAIKSIEAIEGLDLVDVNKFLLLFKKSDEDVKTIINIDERLNDLNTETDSLANSIEDNRENITGAYERNDAILKKLEAFSTFSTHNTNIKADFEGFSIIGGVSETSSADAGVVKITFETAFKQLPYVVSTSYNNRVNDDGHPVIFDVTERGFKVKVLRYENKTIGADVQYKINAKFSYLAFGEISVL